VAAARLALRRSRSSSINAAAATSTASSPDSSGSTTGIHGMCDPEAAVPRISSRSESKVDRADASAPVQPSGVTAATLWRAASRDGLTIATSSSVIEATAERSSADGTSSKMMPSR
jgi:hypothetical protein